jgi:hypothetical protein
MPTVPEVSAPLFCARESQSSALNEQNEIVLPYWDALSPEERSAEMKRRAAKRTKKK